METPEFYQTADHYNAQFTPEKRLSDGDHFLVEDLLDFPNDEPAAGFDAGDDSPAAALDGSCNSSGAEQHFQAADVSAGAPRNGFPDGQFSGGDLSVPCDELAELEWLSNFEEESFSCEDLQKLHLIHGMKATAAGQVGDSSSVAHQYHFQPEPARQPGPMFHTDMSVPAKARSKRSRAPPGNWTSRLLTVSATTPPALSSSSSSDAADFKNTVKHVGSRKKEAQESSAGEGRRCLHCATDKTPQWRTGPMGPKTLCNACGVRYKSGRLVPEYRPAASPTFVLTKHSNSHRKVMELRRQKEMLRAQQPPAPPQQFLHHQSVVFDLSNGDDYLIHQHVGSHFRQLI